MLGRKARRIRYLSARVGQLVRELEDSQSRERALGRVAEFWKAQDKDARDSLANRALEVCDLTARLREAEEEHEPMAVRLKVESEAVLALANATIKAIALLGVRKWSKDRRIRAAVQALRRGMVQNLADGSAATAKAVVERR